MNRQDVVMYVWHLILVGLVILLGVQFYIAVMGAGELYSTMPEHNFFFWLHRF